MDAFSVYHIVDLRHLGFLVDVPAGAITPGRARSLGRRAVADKPDRWRAGSGTD